MSQREYSSDEKQLQIVCQLSEHICDAHGLDEIHALALDALCGVLNTNRCSILLFDSKHVMSFVAWRNLSDEYRRLVNGHSPWKPEDINAEPIYMQDVEKEETLGSLKRVILDEGIQAMAFIPLIFKQRLLGKFMVYFNHPHVFTSAEQLLVKIIAKHVAFAIGVRQIEDDLRVSVKEKEILLREIFHRVKNNLQVVASMLSLQANSMEDEDVRKILQNSINRVQAMSVFHEELNQSNGGRDIDFQQYVTRLVETLIQSYFPEPLSIEREIKCEQRFLDAATAVPLGLMLNEIVTNSLKHAFDNSTHPKIRVAMPDSNTLVIGDNGSGFNVQNHNGKSLGLKLVKLLADQLHAKLEITGPGTTFHIKFEPRQAV